MTKRLSFLDSIRFLACSWVFVNHFIDDLDPRYFALWNTKPYSFFLSGFHVKVGVAFFAVILGYLAAKSGTKKSKSLLRYTINRYSYFLISGLIVNTLIIAFFLLAPENMHILNIRLPDASVKGALLQILSDSIKLNAGIYETFWFIKPFFYASVICFILGRYQVELIPLIILDALFYTTGQGWIAICILGVILFEFIEKGLLVKCLSNRLVILFLVLASFTVIKLFPTESALTYYMDGFAALLFLLAIFKSKTLQRIFSWNRISSVTNKYMAFLILHRQVFHVAAALMADTLKTPTGFFLGMLLSYIITILLSFPVDWVLNKLYDLLCRALTVIPLEKLESTIKES